jgi:hypothetical protein
VERGEEILDMLNTKNHVQSLQHRRVNFERLKKAKKGQKQKKKKNDRDEDVEKGR